MRPRYLEIEGLQSFKELQRIDFDRLSETGLFGIFGPTGSGKSTVLDAITLALYGEVNRALRGTQGIINTDSDSVRVSFTFDLLKDKMRKVYRIERVYKRKKGTENSCEGKIVRLIEITEKGELPLADKQGEVNARIEELVGLKIEDFTRSVVLPQNKFQEFLLMEKARKREMLERIFYLEEYGRQLTEKVAKRLSAVRYKLSNIEGAISTLGNASDKALVEAEGRLENARTARENADRALKLAEIHLNEAKEVWLLQEDLNLYIAKEKEHILQLDEINKKRGIYENSIKAEGMTDAISKFRVVTESLHETDIKLQSVNTEFAQLEISCGEAKTRYASFCKESEAEKPRLIEQRTKLYEAAEIKKDMDNIEEKLKGLRDSYVNLRNGAAALDKEMGERKALIEDSEKKSLECRMNIAALKVDFDYKAGVQAGLKLENELAAAEKNMKAADLKYNDLKVKCEEMSKSLSHASAQRQELQEVLGKLSADLQLHENTRPCDRNAIMDGMNNYHNLKGIYESIKVKQGDIHFIHTKLDSIRKGAEKQANSCRAAEEARTAVEAVLNDILGQVGHYKELYEKNTAYTLAKTLKEGMPCPVCGSASHPVPAAGNGNEENAEIELALKSLQDKQTAAEKELRESENNCIKLAESMRGLEQQLIQISGELEAKKSEYSALLASLPDGLKGLEPDELKTGLDRLLQKNEESMKAIDIWEKKQEEIKKRIGDLTDTLTSCQVEENSRKTEAEVYRKNLLQAEKLLEEAVREYSEKSEAFRSFLNRYGISGIHQELKRIEENERHIDELQKKADELQELVRGLTKELDVKNDQRMELNRKLEEVRVEGDALKRQKDEKESKVRGIAGDRDISGFIKEAEDRINFLGEKEKQLLEETKKLDEQFNSIKAMKASLENQREIYSRSVEEEGRMLGNALVEKGFKTVEEAEHALIPKEQQKLLIREIEDYEKEERNIQAQKNIALKKLGDRSITEDEWFRANETHKTCIDGKEKCVSEFESARNLYGIIKENFTRWVALEKELKEYSRKRELLEQIQKLLKGNSFIEFIAEERLRYIAKEASETLGVLTKYRYALEIDTENGFVIRDNSNGGVHRLVSSLSGGETFLTSLSLALALSKQVQLKGQSPLEFFFLDEGFGTLDSSLLDTVIDSLERLSSRERVIGLISHVPELKSRIARRLVVSPPDAEGRGSRVTIEKA